jgi:hypothetical protein
MHSLQPPEAHQQQPLVYPCLSTCHKLPYLLAKTAQAIKAIEARVVELIYVTVFTTPTHPLHDSHQPLLGLMQLPCCIGVHLALLSSDLINVVKYIMRW